MVSADATAAVTAAVTAAPVTTVTTVDELRAVVGDVMPRAAMKVRPALVDLDREWLAQSPFCLLATTGADGSCDVSPKGDPAGFVHVLDETTIAVPDRPGNRRVDGLLNILDNPHVGLIFLIPGRGDTLRINGRATIVSEAPWFGDLAVRGRRPQLAMVIEIDEVFHHCSKAFLRSKLWEPDSWAPENVPSRAVIAKALERPEEDLADIERYYGPSYADGLY
jgi:PPOX class probable FMN-dependent enzyme